MADDNPPESTDNPPAATGDTTVEEAPNMAEGGPEKIEGGPDTGEGSPGPVDGEQVKTEGEQEKGEGEQVMVEGEAVMVEGEPVMVEGEPGKLEGDQEKTEGEQEKVEGEQEKVEGEKIKEDEGAGEVQGEPLGGELMEGEQMQGEETPDQQTTTGEEGQSTATEADLLGEEEAIPEELPPDPAAPFDLSDSKEALKLPFELSPEQLVVVEELWQSFQDHTPAYSAINGYITPKELVYMLKALLLMTYTPEQMEEMIEFCVRPPHPEGHINWEQFLHIVTMRQRDFIIEEQIRKSLEVFDPKHTGIVEREIIRDLLLNYGYRMPQKMVDNFIKEVDISGDGELSIEDVVGTMCIDLNQEDLQMLRDAVNPPKEVPNMEDIDRDIEKAEDVTRKIL